MPFPIKEICSSKIKPSSWAWANLLSVIIEFVIFVVQILVLGAGLLGALEIGFQAGRLVLGRDDERRLALRADDRVARQVIVPLAAFRADAFHAPFRLRHGRILARY